MSVKSFSEPLSETTEVTLAGERSARLRLAQTYPFDQLDQGYVYRAGKVDDGPFDLAERIAVAASGSNGSPAQLQRKFGDCPEGIPVTTAIIRHHAVVYSAHLTRYGSLPAALWPVADAVVSVVVTWLTEAQLERMHETEVLGDHYAFEPFRPEHVELHPPAAVGDLYYYKSLRGPLRHRGQPVRLAEIWTGNCPLPVMTQPAALRYIHRRLEPELSFDAFLEKIIDDPDFRRACVARLDPAD